MQFSFFRTLLFSVLVSLLLSSCALAETDTKLITDKVTDQEQVTAPITVTENLSEELQVSNPAHLDFAASYVGTTELTGQNDGPEVERFLESVGLQAGNPYCAAFISYVLDETPGIHKPTVRSGLASHFITDGSIDARHVLRGTVDVGPGSIVIWQRGNTIYGHAGFIEDQESTNKFATIEANTSSGVYGNQADGDGVWRRSRTIQPGNHFRITRFTPVVYHS